MLRLTDTQFLAFRDLARAQSLSDAIAYLQDRFPDACRPLGDAGLSDLLETAVARGATYGVTSAYDVRRLAECLLLHGADFPLGDAHGWACLLLEKDGMAGREKMNALAHLECFRGRP